MRSIIVGVDDSRTAKRAAKVAAQLACDTGAELTVVCAYARERAVDFETSSDHWHLTASGVYEATAERIAAQIAPLCPGTKIRGVAIEGKPADALAEAAEQFNADLIVVGNKRVQGPGRVLGSIAAAVARQAPCDVYIAHTT